VSDSLGNVPSCPDCGRLDLEKHECEKKTRHYNDCEWAQLLVHRKSIADRKRFESAELYLKNSEKDFQKPVWQNKYEFYRTIDAKETVANHGKAHTNLVQEKINSIYEEYESIADAMNKKEIEELSTLHYFLQKMVTEMSQYVGFSKKVEIDFQMDEPNIQIQSAEIKKELDRMSDKIQKFELWAKISHYENSGNRSPEKEKIMDQITVLEDRYDESEDAVYDIINGIKSIDECKVVDDCTCDSHPTMQCRVHPSREYHTHFEGRDGNKSVS